MGASIFILTKFVWEETNKKKKQKKKKMLFPTVKIDVYKILLLYFLHLFFHPICCTTMKETFSFVPQELAKLFIEPTHGKKICINYEEDDSEDDTQKWSMVRNIFNKFHTTGPSHGCLSTYGVLQNKRIGEGVSATVQLLQRGQEKLAVKIFRKKKRREHSSIYMKALASEFCISSALNHPNVIKTLDFVRLDEDHTRYCIVMEYVGIFFFNHVLIIMNDTVLLLLVLRRRYVWINQARLNATRRYYHVF